MRNGALAIQNWEVMEKLLEDQYEKSAGARCDRAARCGVPTLSEGSVMPTIDVQVHAYERKQYGFG